MNFYLKIYFITTTFILEIFFIFRVTDYVMVYKTLYCKDEIRFIIYIMIFMIFIFCKGADVDGRTALGHTALHVAAAQDHGFAVDLLLEKGYNML